MMMRYALAVFGMALGAAGASAVAEDSQPAKVQPTAASSAATAGTTGDAQGEPGPWHFLDKYCSECHNSTDWAGGVAFDTMTADALADDARVWEEAVRKLRGRLMPPAGEPQPDQGAVDEQVAWLETQLDKVGSAQPNPGNVVMHRLNRTEYEHEVKRLLNLDIDAAAFLPKDTKASGFDNVATVLKVSPSFLDQYIVAAHDVSVQAVGDPAPAPSSTTYRASSEVDQDGYVEGMPLGTRGGMLVEHLFPADGEYKFDLSSAGLGGGYIVGLDSRQKLIMMIDGKQVFETEFGGKEDLKALDQTQTVAAKEIRARLQNVRLPVKAGPHKIAVTFVARTFAENDDMLEPLGGGGGLPRVPRVFSMDIVGPENPTGISETPSRARIFQCRPANEAEELPCAKRIITTLARRAYRRPVTEADLDFPLRFYKVGRQKGGFDGGIQQAVMSILASPKFLYRFEAVPTNATPGKVYPISDVELASRLSFFLWSQGPDDQLLDIATSGKLRAPGVVDEQIKRMLADPRAKTLTTGFADQWLTVDEMDSIEPDPSLFPEFDGSLRQAFRREIEMFVNSVFSEDQSVVNLLAANYTFVNERLALHYGIPNIRGERFRRIVLQDSNRWGLLGKGAFLMGMSYGNRTSPVRRGFWILDAVMGTPPSAPPPGIEALKENEAGKQAHTVRERMESHRANPQCNSCHGVIDPLGFSLENYDAIGAWRDKDRETGTVIDTGGDLHGNLIHGPDDLRNLLVGRPEQFVQTLTEKLMTYALGRELDYRDMPTVRAVVHEAARHDYRFSSIVSGIVKSPAFEMQMVPAAEGAISKTTEAALH